MISNKTVFILGAGAHIPYGFPSGKALIKDVIASLSHSKINPYLSLTTLPQRCGIDPMDVQDSNLGNFINALSNAGQASIDTFLNSNQHMSGFDIVGKIGISQTLLKIENDTFHTNSDIKHDAYDWFEYLFEKMCEGITSASQFVSDNKITFVTFNYDRLLEHKFFVGIKNSFGISDDIEVLELVNSIPIHHVYGSLGSFTPNSFGNLSLWADSFKTIQTIHEAQKSKSNALKDSINAMSQADIICILGFGFHRENISLLTLPDMIEKISGIVFACRLGLTDEEIRRVLVANNLANKENFKICNDAYDALGTLKNYSVFND
jgi:hypothetical protein